MPSTQPPNKIAEIQNVAAKLFASQGYHSTSIREIAGVLGINQATLYHYFKSKEEILFQLINGALDDAYKTLIEIRKADLPPVDRIKRVLRFYTQHYAGDQERLILAVNERESLSKDHQRVLVDKERQYVLLFNEMFKELIAARKMKDIPPSVATFAFFGMVLHTINWYHKDGLINLDQLADLFCDIFMGGILKEPVQ